MKKRRIFISVVLFICLVVCVSYPIIMNHLVVDEKPVQSDVIIVPEGQEYIRASKASELLHEGYSRSDKIIISPMVDTNAEIYEEFGVEFEQIIPENEATSTYENAVHTLEIMEESGFDSAIVTSSDYHMLRTKMIYERVNRDYDFELTFVAAYQVVDGQLVPWVDGQLVSWDEAGDELKAVAKKEFWKYWGYLLGLYHFIDV